MKKAARPLRKNSLQMRLARRQVARIVAALPADLAEKAAQVAVIYRAFPDADLAAQMHEAQDGLLGLFVGESLDQTGETPCPFPPQIFLFLANIWAESRGDLRRFKREVAKTYLHELGHFLGWDEDALSLRGLE